MHIISVHNVLHHTDGIPNDGVPIEEVVTVSLALTVVYMILAVAGIVFAIICLIFTLIFRKKKFVACILNTCTLKVTPLYHRLIRLSSPNLNYIIGLGAIILYLNVISFVIPTTNADFVSVLCNVSWSKLQGLSP